jgi:hypothetical protein
LVKVKVGTGAWTYRMKYPIVQSNEEKISPKCVLRGLIELSTMSNGSTRKVKRLEKGIERQLLRSNKPPHSPERDDVASVIKLNYFPPSSPGLFLHIEALFKMAEVGTGPERKQAQPKDQKRRSEGNSKEERRENGVGSGLAGSRGAQASLRPRHPLLIRGKVFPIGSFRPFSRSGVPLPSSPLRF